MPLKEENKMYLLIDFTILPEYQDTIVKMKNLQILGLFESTSLANSPSPFEEDIQVKLSLDDSGILKTIRKEGKAPSSEIDWSEGNPIYSPEQIKQFGERMFGRISSKTRLNAINLFFLYLDLRESWYHKDKAASMLVTDNTELLEKRHY